MLCGSVGAVFVQESLVIPI